MRIKLGMVVLIASLFAQVANAQTLIELKPEWAERAKALKTQWVNDANEYIFAKYTPPVTSGNIQYFLGAKECKKNWCISNNMGEHKKIGIEPSVEGAQDWFFSQTESEIFGGKYEHNQMVDYTHMLLQTHEWNKALRETNVQLKRFYSSPQTYWQRSIALFELGKPELAIKDLDAAQLWIDKAPDKFSSEVKYFIPYQRAIILLQMGKIEEANAAKALAMQYFDANIYKMSGTDYLINNAFANLAPKPKLSPQQEKFAGFDKYINNSVFDCANNDARQKLAQALDENYRYNDSLKTILRLSANCKNIADLNRFSTLYIQKSKMAFATSRTEENFENILRAYNDIADILYQNHQYVFESQILLMKYKFIHGPTENINYLTQRQIMVAGEIKNAVSEAFEIPEMKSAVATQEFLNIINAYNKHIGVGK